MNIYRAEKLNFANLPLDGDAINFSSGATWYLKNDTTGWELRSDYASWRTTHPTARHFKSLNDLIQEIHVMDYNGRI